MVKNKVNRKSNQDVVLNLGGTDVVIVEQKVATPTFVVTRGGLRVSDVEYNSPEDQKAVAEANFWKSIVTKFPDGTRIEIVQFDKKKHRVW
jgi:hypothetical protein